MGRYKTSKWDYLPKGLTLPDASKKLYGIEYVDTTDAQAKKVKAYVTKELEKRKNKKSTKYNPKVKGFDNTVSNSQKRKIKQAGFK